MKLCKCFCHGLEMCTWFGYNPWINFCHFFHFVNFVIFWPQILWKCIDNGYLVSATPYTTSCLSLCNFAHLFSHGLKMCMWFEFNPAVDFCHISILLTLSFFASSIYFFLLFLLYESLFLVWKKVYRQWVPCECNSSYSFPLIVLKHCRCFQHGMNMCMWFWYNTLIIFSHFFCFVNLVSFFYMKCYQGVETVGTLWAQLLLQFSTDCFETLQMFSAWNEDMHMVLE